MTLHDSFNLLKFIFYLLIIYKGPNVKRRILYNYTYVYESNYLLFLSLDGRIYYENIGIK